MIYLVYLSNCSSIAVSRVTRETTMKSVASSTKTSTSRTTQSSTMATRPTPKNKFLALKIKKWGNHFTLKRIKQAIV